jgi:hypothetical protein
LTNGKSTLSSSPIPITHSVSQHSHHSSSQPTAPGYRRIYSPQPIDTSNIVHGEPSPRRYSASAAVSPPSHHNNLQVPPILNLIPASPQQILPDGIMKKLTERQWQIPIYLYGCNKVRLASSLVLSNEQQLRNPGEDSYVDCKKDDTESTTTLPVTTAPHTLKPRKRGKIRKEYTKSNSWQ